MLFLIWDLRKIVIRPKASNSNPNRQRISKRRKVKFGSLKSTPINLNRDSVKLIYLSEANLRDRLLIRDLVFNYKIEEKALVVHSSFNGTLRDTRFVTKRLSSLFSEAMVYNNAFSGDQRKFCFRDEEGKLKIDVSRVQKLIAPIQMIILGPLIENNGEVELFDAEEMIQPIRSDFDISEVLLFPGNPLSPLGGKSKMIENEEEYKALRGVFEEEEEVLSRALRHKPARIVVPKYLNPEGK